MVDLSDWYLVFGCLVALIILLVVNAYILVHFQHPDDKWEAWSAKILVVLGLTFAEGSVLLLTLDVANNSLLVGCEQGWNQLCGSLDMYLFWQIVYASIWVLVCGVIPFMIFYYEEDDGFGNKDKNRLCVAFKWELLVLCVTVLVLLPMYFSLGTTDIPVRAYAASIADLTSVAVSSAAGQGAALTDAMLLAAEAVNPTGETLSIDVTFLIYVAALMSFLGWFLFVVFAGIGLGALPIDLVLAFVYRPTPLDARAIEERLGAVRARARELREAGALLKREREAAMSSKQGFIKRKARQRRDRIAVNKFKQHIIILEQDYEMIANCRDYYQNNYFIVPYIKLFFGILGIIFSLLWILHIILYILIPSSPTYFLNDYFTSFDQWFPLLGNISVMIFSMYLLAAAIHGCFKFGCRFFLLPLHPMKPHGTYLNSFLFNTSLVLFCTLPVVQFSVESFSEYAQYTDVSQMFGVQIKYMKFFNYFFANNVFVIILLVLAGLSTVYLILRPQDRPASPDEIKSTVQKNMISSYSTK
eukprot:CAMPEP_0206385890 /NCGR_PEP_ID=MMETSP0294-20121207/15568_1 /ASSEMBLY_ACC=CAM_ASM_000327 /TAXON_ID=39354 /ORGANISM="Heterosigma akashiwo, Strain CCMP2393" /LENGTH=528 /DNA_ID=CAMNT_0053836735 /DNA_START=77 /DNA_END=1663 /DNA_ORIENTATION=+